MEWGAYNKAFNHLNLDDDTIVFCIQDDMVIKDWGFVAHVHDEIQAVVKPQFTSIYKDLAINSFKKAGEFYNLKCPLTGEAKEGKNWMETH